MSKYENFLGLGIAGNFALHLAQAGELEEFKDIITAEEAAPKGMFPFYLPNCQKTSAKEILKTYPISSTTIKLPKENANVQAEPEVGLVCSLEYVDGRLSAIKPTHFGAYDDCSIRVAGASKISDKKNWGQDSKGFSETLFEIDEFSSGGVMDDFSVCGFLKRDGEIHQYGENVELSGYSYFYEKLTDWMRNQINSQKDFGPLEALSEYVADCEFPTQAIISIGATRYSTYGETTFLNAGDEVVIIVYDSKLVSFDSLLRAVKENDYDAKTMSVLAQEVRS
jgi:hypothetical protein